MKLRSGKIKTPNGKLVKKKKISTLKHSEKKQVETARKVAGILKKVPIDELNECINVVSKKRVLKEANAIEGHAVAENNAIDENLKNHVQPEIKSNEHRTEFQESKHRNDALMNDESSVSGEQQQTLQQATAAEQVTAEQGPQNLSEDDDNVEQEHREMPDFIARPLPLKLDGNIAENWKRFKRSFEIFLTAIECNNKPDATKIALFRNVLGEDGNDAYDSFTLTADERKVYVTVISAFDAFCKPKTNEVYERFVFYQRNQKEGEPFDTFLLDIRHLVKTCEFGELEESMLRDRIVMGVNHKKLQRTLLETAKLTYTQAVEKCRAHEKAHEQTNNMNKTTAEVSEVKETTSKHNQGYNNRSNQQNTYKDGRNEQNGGQARNYNRNNYNNNSSQNSYRSNNYDRNKKFSNSDNCKYCNYRHAPNNCPAYGKNCNVCAKRNHFAAVCRSKQINSINAQDFEHENDDLYCTTVTRVYERSVGSVSIGVRPRWKEDMMVNGKMVSYKVDTGSDATTLPRRLLDAIAPDCKLVPSETVFRGFGGGIVRPIGMLKLPCTLKNRTKTIEIDVVDTDDVPLLGFVAAVQFGLIDTKLISDHRTRKTLNHFL